MIEGLQIEGIDMSNPDVCKLIDAFSKRFEQVVSVNLVPRFLPFT